MAKKKYLDPIDPITKEPIEGPGLGYGVPPGSATANPEKRINSAINYLLGGNPREATTALNAADKIIKFQGSELNPDYVSSAPAEIAALRKAAGVLMRAQNLSPEKAREVKKFFNKNYTNMGWETMAEEAKKSLGLSIS